eukprot:10680616-Ditylum_brightwellii.AAC.1
MDKSIKQLKSKWSATQKADPLESEVESTVMSISQRYPQLWGRDKKFDVMTWDQFELPKGQGTAQTVTYDLTQNPWKTLRDH